MQIPASFEYERATSVDNALELLKARGPEARLLAGGHSLLPMMKLRLAAPECLIDIDPLAGELGYVREQEDEVRIGAMTRHRELLESELLASRLAIFTDAEHVIADPVCAIAARSAVRCARPTPRRTSRRSAPQSARARSSVAWMVSAS